MQRLLLAVLMIWPAICAAQDNALRIATVTRPPFSMTTDAGDTGYSIELMRQIAAVMERDVTFIRTEKFSDMLALVETGQVDGAIANISITAGREAIMDFSQPIFESGLQIMVPATSTGPSIRSIIMRPELLRAILAAFALLFAGGMLMWLFERKRQEYFDRPLKDAIFPSFWWALNLVVNGGFEERMPRSPAGRVFATMLVVASLFIVSFFVANITAVMTVETIQASVTSIKDLDGKRVGTIEGSTAERFLLRRQVNTTGYEDLGTLLAKFEQRDLDAVVFDGPILAYYVKNEGAGKGRMIDTVFQRENFGIALPSGSPLREQFNQSLLSLRENGDFAELSQKWFGQN